MDEYEYEGERECKKNWFKMPRKRVSIMPITYSTNVPMAKFPQNWQYYPEVIVLTWKIKGFSLLSISHSQPKDREKLYIAEKWFVNTKKVISRIAWVFSSVFFYSISIKTILFGFAQCAPKKKCQMWLLLVLSSWSRYFQFCFFFNSSFGHWKMLATQ